MKILSGFLGGMNLIHNSLSAKLGDVLKGVFVSRIGGKAREGKRQWCSKPT